MKFFRFLFILLLVFTSLLSHTQGDFYFAFTADIGSKFQRGGILVKFNIDKNRVEYTAAAQLKFALKGYGPQTMSSAMSFHLGANYRTKKLSNLISYDSYLPYTFFVQNQFANKFGYVYNFYLDQHKTSQGSGTIYIQLDKARIILENDLFGNLSGKDQYRTGAMGIFYQSTDYFIGLKNILWTGQTRCTGMQKIKSNYPSSNGYKKIDECLYSNVSHGIAGVQVGFRTSNSAYPSIFLGRDDERIRHAIQNRFIHDNPLITADNPHIPMLDTNGNQYLFKDKQEIKKGSWMAQLALNYAWFY